MKVSAIRPLFPAPALLALRRLGRQAGARIGIAMLSCAVLGALLAPLLVPRPSATVDLAQQLRPPSVAHPAGTDFFGRDIAIRLLWGARTTLATAALAVGLGAVAGTLLGLLAGYSRGWIGQAFVGVIDLMLAFPALLLAMVVVALLGPGLRTLGLAVGIAGIPNYARLARSVVLSLRSASYIEAARALGAGTVRILARHLLPGLVAPILAWATLDFGWAILHVAGLSFLGLGAAPPEAEWGLMLFEGREYVGTAPWASAFPGLAITLTVLGATLLGDALGDSVGTHRR